MLNPKLIQKNSEETKEPSQSKNALEEISEAQSVDYFGEPQITSLHVPELEKYNKIWNIVCLPNDDLALLVSEKKIGQASQQAYQNSFIVFLNPKTGEIKKTISNLNRVLNPGNPTLAALPDGRLAYYYGARVMDIYDQSGNRIKGITYDKDFIRSFVALSNKVLACVGRGPNKDTSIRLRDIEKNQDIGYRLEYDLMINIPTNHEGNHAATLVTKLFDGNLALAGTNSKTGKSKILILDPNSGKCVDTIEVKGKISFLVPLSQDELAIYCDGYGETGGGNLKENMFHFKTATSGKFIKILYLDSSKFHFSNLTRLSDGALVNIDKGNIHFYQFPIKILEETKEIDENTVEFDRSSELEFSYSDDPNPNKPSRLKVLGENLSATIEEFQKNQQKQQKTIQAKTKVAAQINTIIQQLFQLEESTKTQHETLKTSVQDLELKITNLTKDLETQKQQVTTLAKALNVQNKKLKSQAQEIQTLKQQIANIPKEDNKTEQAFFDRMLLTAAKQGRKQKVKHALEMDANINACDESGYTALHLSALHGQEEVINILLEQFPNLLNTAKDLGKGQTALHIMAAAGNVQMVNFLLGKNTDYTLADNANQIPYDVATKETRVAIANKMLFSAAKIGNKDLAKQALEKGAEINAKTLNHGETALHVAVYHKYKELVEFLLSCGANPTETNTRGETPSKYAETSNEELKKTLANKNLIAAAQNDDINGVIDAISLGVDVNQTVDKQGLTALHWAARNKSEKMVALLLSKNAKVDVTDADGQIPLHWAIINDEKNVIELLLKEHAQLQIEIKVKNKEGKTPTLLAHHLNKEELSEYIAERWGALKKKQKMQAKLKQTPTKLSDHPNSFISNFGKDNSQSMQSETQSSEQQQTEETVQSSLEQVENEEVKQPSMDDFPRP